MTAKQLWEAVLIELNKLEAPSILLEDFNYLANKAINQYINRKYNIYDTNQQSTDDLRVLKATVILDATPTYKIYGGDTEESQALYKTMYGATYEVNLPDDYLHILNCICIYKINDNANYKCYDKDLYVKFGADRLTADEWGGIINNFYMKPSYKRPYYYIHNINVNDSVPTNPVKLDDEGYITQGTDYILEYTLTLKPVAAATGTFSIESGTKFNLGTIVTITYTPSEDEHFYWWTGDVDEDADKSNLTQTITMDKDKTLGVYSVNIS